MDKLIKFLHTTEIQTDDFGRAIITDPSVLNKLNGALLGNPEFVPMDTACGNGNCVC